VTELQSPSSKSMVCNNPSLWHELVIPPKTIKLFSSEVMAMLAKAWGGRPSLAPREKVGVVVLSCYQLRRCTSKSSTYWVDQNIIGNLEIGRRDLSTDNVHRSLRRYIYSLMSPSSSRAQPKRNRGQRQCRKNDWLHRTTMSQGERKCFLVERVYVKFDYKVEVKLSSSYQ
jgi:hypothetical protein